MKKCFLLLSILFLPLAAAAQTIQEIHSKIIAAVEQKNYAAAIGELGTLEKSDVKVFQLNNYDYLLARMSEKTGDLATAMANYQAVVNRNSVLRGYALRHLAQIARTTGNLLLERIYLREILTFAPDSLISDAAQARMSKSYFESRDFDAVIRLLDEQNGDAATNTESKAEENSKIKIQNLKPEDKTQKPGNRNPKRREELALLGQAYLQSGKAGEAREVFTKLIVDLPNPAQPDDFALAGAKGLDAIDGGAENFGKKAPPLTDAEHFRRASIYQFNRNFPLARLHFQAVVERFPQSSYVSDALFQIGRGLVQERNYNEAINWFERVQAEFPDSDIARDALSQTASAYSRVNKPKEAVARYQKFIEKYPDADNLERAFLNIVDVLRDRGEDFDALKWTLKTQQAFRGKLPEAIALFAQARIHIAQNNWTDALNDLNALQNFSDLGGTRVPGGTNRAEITFLKGLVLENLQRYDEAIDVYFSIPDGRNEYYGWRATERLRDLVKTEKTKQFVDIKLARLLQQNETLLPDEQRKNLQSAYRLTGYVSFLEKIKKLYAQLANYKTPNFQLSEFGRRKVLEEKSADKNRNHHQNLADELLFLGLYDEATPELESAIQESKTVQTKDQNNVNYSLAVSYKRGEMANRAVAFAEPLWRNVPADYQIELIPRDQIELLYPAPYSDALLNFAPARNVDARFILAIMRQESRFRADVKSFAAARGLLQFISTTSDKIAAELGENNFTDDELYNPPTAILFGAQYLSNLFRQFPNQPAAVAASYNGGEDNMARWLARAKTDAADRYVSEIAFTQSKDYVCKVMANYRVYQMLYDEELKTK